MLVVVVTGRAAPKTVLGSFAALAVAKFKTSEEQTVARPARDSVARESMIYHDILEYTIIYHNLL